MLELARQLSPFAVVLVEDNPADAAMLRIALGQHDVAIEIIHFETGQLAMEYLNVAAPPPVPSRCDLVLLDLNLPLVSGFDILRSIRAAQHLRTLPVIVMSGSSNVDDINRCRELGVDDYIRKPSQLPEIFNMAKKIVFRVSDFAPPDRLFEIKRVGLIVSPPVNYNSNYETQLYSWPPSVLRCPPVTEKLYSELTRKSFSLPELKYWNLKEIPPATKLWS
jgi:chemotaxis family two-component system response regulator Rcp1